MNKEEIIALARRGPSGEPEILGVLEVARETEDRRLLGVCLDCFRSVLADSAAPSADLVVEFLGALLEDASYRRIRRRLLITLAFIGRASCRVLPAILETFKNNGKSSVLVPARSAVLYVAWKALESEDPTERAHGLAAFLSIGSLGAMNLALFLREHPNHPDTEKIEPRARGWFDYVDEHVIPRRPDSGEGENPTTVPGT